MKFDSYHPAINLIYFVTATFCMIAFDHPVYVVLSYAAAFIYSVKLNGIRGLIFDVCLIPFILGYTALYSYYNHFGVTYLRQNIIGNNITLEAAAYGLEIGLTAASVIMLISCLFAVFSSDKIVYLFGRISPKLSLFLSIILRTVPRVKKKARGVNTAQKGIGMSPGQGNIFRRIVNAFRVVSVVVTWILENFVESSISMKSRGYSLKGRTAFSIYRFDNRDRTFVIVIFLCIMLTAAAAMLDQTHIYYDPEIVMNRITPVSYIFYAAYAVLLLLPAGLQTAGEIKFRQLRKDIAGKTEVDFRRSDD